MRNSAPLPHTHLCHPPPPSDRACHELCKLPELRQLNLSQNRSLSDGGVRVLAGGLKEVLLGLNISYTSVTDASMTTLASMKVGTTQGEGCSWGGLRNTGEGWNKFAALRAVAQSMCGSLVRRPQYCSVLPGGRAPSC